MKKKIFYKQSIIYGIGIALNSLSGIILMPFLLHIFPPKEFGKIEVYILFLNLFLILSFLGLQTAMQYYYYDSRSLKYKSSVLTTTLSIWLTTSIIIGVLLYIFSPFISKFIYGSEDFDLFFKIMGLTLPVYILFNFSLEVCKIKFWGIFFNILALGNSLFYISFSCFLVLYWDKNIISVVWGKFIAVVLLAIIGSFKVLPFIDFSLVSLKVAKKLFKYGLYLLPATIILYLYSYCDRYMLLRLKGIDAVGIYSVGDKLSKIILMGVTAFQMIWNAYAIAIKDKKWASEFYNKIFLYFTAIFLFASLFIFSFSKPIIILLSKREFSEVYAKSYIVVGLLSLSVTFYGLYYIFRIPFDITKQTKYIMYVSFITLLINVFLNYLLIPKWGINGAAFATMSSNILSVLYLYFMGKKVYKIPFDVKKGGLMFITTLLLGIMSAVLTNKNYFLPFFSVLLYIIVVVIVLHEELSEAFILMKNKLKSGGIL